MRILIVDPGFEYSTLALAESYYRAFERLGYEVVEYDLLKSLNIVKSGLLNIVKNNIPVDYLTEMACAPILNQVVQDKIDVVIMIHGYYLNPSIVTSLRRLDVKTALILTDDPMQVDVSSIWSSFYDYVFTNEENTLSCHRNSYHLPVAVDETIFYPREVENSFRSEILFAGSFYPERIEFLEKIKNLLLNKDTRFVGAKTCKFEDSRLEKLCCKNKLSYEEISKYVVGAKINIDIPCNEFRRSVYGITNSNLIKATCLSPRIFECFASKSMVLTNRNRTNITKLFPNLLPTYSTIDEFCAKLEDLLRLDTVRKEIVEETYKYCLNNHTYLHRAKKIESIMNLIPTKGISTKPTTYLNEKVKNCWNPVWLQNYQYCKEKGYYTKERSIQAIIDKFVCNNSECSLISNGPSLEKTLYIVKRSIGYMLCVNGAFKILQNEGKMIDGVCVIHGNKDVYERCFKDTSIEGVDLFASTIVCPEVVDHWLKFNQNIWFYNTTKDSPIRETIVDYTGYPVLGAGFTVMYSALTVLKSLGFKKINLYGCDLCYVDYKRYAYEYMDYDKKISNFVVVKDANGHPVLTDQILLKTRNSVFEFIKNNEDTQFIVHGGGILYNESLSNLRNVKI